MRPKASLHLSGAAIGAALLLTLSPAQLAAQQTAPAGVTIGESDLGGLVSGPNGPEALPTDHPMAGHLDVYQWLTVLQEYLVLGLMDKR